MGFVVVSSRWEKLQESYIWREEGRDSGGVGEEGEKGKRRGARAGKRRRGKERGGKRREKSGERGRGGERPSLGPENLLPH